MPDGETGENEGKMDGISEGSIVGDMEGYFEGSIDRMCEEESKVTGEDDGERERDFEI